MFPSNPEKYRAHRDIVRGERKIRQLPIRPSSRWRYQFVMIADFKRGRQRVNYVECYSNPLERSLSNRAMIRMFDRAVIMAQRALILEYDGEWIEYDEEDMWAPELEQWELVNVRQRAIIVYRQYSIKRGEKTLKPITNYLKKRKRKRRKPVRRKR